MGTKVVRRRIHLSGRDVDNALISLNEGGQVKVEDDYKIKSIHCKRCDETISPGMNFCAKCALPVNLSNEYTREEELEKEIHTLREKYDTDIELLKNAISDMQQLLKSPERLVEINKGAANVIGNID
jgi:hypothetical protein